MRIQVKRFAKEMERNLRANDDRLGWENEQPFYLLARLIEEVGELSQAIIGNAEKGHVFKEAADVGNLAMMIADVIFGLSENE